MAFRPLTDAECGQKNALLHLTSHVTHDHAFAGNQHGQLFPNSSGDQLVEQFLQETRALPQTFRMDDLMREMHEIESQRYALPPVPASMVKDHLHHDDAWAQQYIEDGKMFHNDVNNEAVWGNITLQNHPIQPSNPEITTVSSTLTNKFDNWVNNSNLYNENSIQEINSEFLIHQPQIQPILPNPIQLSAQELTENLDDSKFEYSKFMKFMKQVGDGEINLEDTGKLSEEEVQSWSDEFLNTEFNQNTFFTDDFKYKESVLSGGNEKIILKKISNCVMDDVVRYDIEKEFKSEVWDKIQDELRTKGSINVNDFVDWDAGFQPHDGNLLHYIFTDDNPMVDVVNPLERGKELLKEGDLPSAVLCFEAAVKKEPENPEAWFYLGRTQSENEQDPLAIAALKKVLTLEPNNLEALMTLAVSYTNETYYYLAGKTLIKWLKINPKYSDLVPSEGLLGFDGYKSGDLTGQVIITSILSPEHKKIIQDLFIKAAQRNPNDIDPEVQTGLGVLCNLSGEYEKAADCFRAALSVRPDDAKLWNRLGATLANGSQSEQAVEAYRQALSLEPGFIRARYNVGVVCINLRAYKEAVEHFLTALNQQARGKDIDGSKKNSQMSDSIWTTLRMCISLLNRNDLISAVDEKNLQTLNKAYYIVD